MYVMHPPLWYHRNVTVNLAVRILRETLPKVQLVYLFGSAARGDMHEKSDIDLAFLCPDAIDSVIRYSLQEKIAAEMGRDIDLVDLRAASTVMRVEVLRDAVLLYASDETTKAEFEMIALSMYAKLNEERKGILDDIRERGLVFGKE